MNLKKIKEMLKSKNGMIATGVVLGALVIGIASSVMLNGESKESGKVENNKQVAVNKDDNKNKTDKEQEKIKEEVNKKEHSNTLIEDKNEEVASTKEENSTSTNNSKVETNNSTSKPSNTTNNTSSNKPQSNEKPSAPVNIHTHSWQEVYKDVAHSEEGHWEDVLVSAAWTEEVPIYEDVERAICNGCGVDITDDIYNHTYNALVNGNTKCGAWHSEWKQVQIGTNTINHDAVYEKKWVVDKAAWTEKVLTGHQCSCGATK